MGMEVVAFIGLFLLVAFIAYLFYTTRHKERMSLIESGRDAGLFKGGSDPQYMGALKWGLVLVSLGIGAAVGINLDMSYNNDGPLYTLPMLLGSGGAGLLVYYFIARNQDEDLD